MKALTSRLMAIALSVVACSKSDVSTPLEEQLDRMRVLGVIAEPLVSQLAKEGESRTTNLQVVVSVPIGQDVSLLGNEIEGGGVKIAPDQMSVDSISYEEHAGFRLARINVFVPVPAETVFPTSPNASPTNQSGGSVSYSFAISVPDRTVIANGSFIARASDSADLAWMQPEITVNNPTADASVPVDGVNVDLTHTSPQTDSYLVGWFVSSGTMSNRRATASYWVPGSTGTQSIVATVRGSQFGSFAIKVIDVKAE